MTDRLPRRTEDGEPTDLGRPLSLTVDLSNEIFALLRRGLTQEDVIRITGVARSTFYSWLDRSRELAERYNDPNDPLDDLTATIEELRLLDFLDGYTGARARGKADALGAIRAGMAEDWRAAAWYLERSFPDEFGRRDRLDVSTEERTAIVIRWPEEEQEIEDAEIVEEDEDEETDADG